MKRIFAFAFTAAVVCTAGAHTVEVVSANARSPWNSILDVDFKIDGAAAGDLFKVEVSAKYGNGQKNLFARTYVSEPVCGRGANRVSWNIGADYPDLKTDDLQVAVTASPMNVDSLDVYMVIDLSSGPESKRYPVSYTFTAPTLVPTNDLVACAADPNRTTKLWLKRVKGTEFPFGGTDTNKGKGIFKARLSPFYMGIFELTQMQYALVTDEWPSNMTNVLYRAARPVELVNYEDVIGHNRWPENRVVTESSYIGKMRSRTGLSTFSLPTEAQWECACRAGNTKSLTISKTTGRYNFAGESTRNEAPDEAGTAIVGSYIPNSWGLYDTLGNVWEMCLDAYIDDDGLVELYFGSNPGDDPIVNDPVGPGVNTSKEEYHATRGGGWNNSSAGYCTAYRRDRGCNPITGTRNKSIGFRVAVSPEWGE